MLNSIYFSYTLLVVSLVLLAVHPSIFNTVHYTYKDVMYFTLSGVAHYVAQTTQSLAYKYDEATKVTPIVYSIGLFLILIDIFVFQYNFNCTDMTGVIIVVASLAIPIINKLKVHKE